MKPAGEQSGGFRPYIVVGDRTSKGGIVFTGSPIVKWGPAGQAIARVGDRATCKCNQCKSRGYTVIVSGTPTFKADGQYVARDGDFTDCGAVLMDVGGADFAEASKLAALLNTNSDARPTPNSNLVEDPSSAQETGNFDQHFLVKDTETGEPIANIPYRLKLADGREIRGRTDRNGLTKKIAANSALTVSLEVPCLDDNASKVGS